MTDESSALIVCDGLSRRYGRTRALDGLDLVVRAGAPIALVGPNGAGKTTLLSLLSGFVRPSGGSVRVLGERPGSTALSGRLAALPQDALFDPRLGVRRQLGVLAELQGFARRASRIEADRVLELVGLADAARLRPTALSHGMRKRVSLAQALLGAPELVLLDEPTAGIDPENARALRALIVDGAARCTFLVSSHNLDELERMCGSVIQLEAGRLVRHEALHGTSETRRTTSAPLDDGHAAGGSAIAIDGELTAELLDVPVELFREAVLGLDGVRSADERRPGDWRIVTADESSTAVALLALLHDRDWRWRRLVRGRSLEERLYGD